MSTCCNFDSKTSDSKPDESKVAEHSYPLKNIMDLLAPFNVSLFADAYETPDSFVVRVDVPGVSKSDINISIKDDTRTLSIVATRKSPTPVLADGKGDPTYKYHIVETVIGELSKKFVLPSFVNFQEDVKTSFVDGVLELVFKRKESTIPRVIKL